MIRVAGQGTKLRWRYGSFPNTCITLGRLVPCFCEGRCLQVKFYPVLCDARPQNEAASFSEALVISGVVYP